MSASIDAETLLILLWSVPHVRKNISFIFLMQLLHNLYFNCSCQVIATTVVFRYLLQSFHSSTALTSISTAPIQNFYCSCFTFLLQLQFHDFYSSSSTCFKLYRTTSTVFLTHLQFLHNTTATISLLLTEISWNFQKWTETVWKISIKCTLCSCFSQLIAVVFKSTAAVS